MPEVYCMSERMSGENMKLLYCSVLSVNINMIFMAKNLSLDVSGTEDAAAYALAENAKSAAGLFTSTF